MIKDKVTDQDLLNETNKVIEAMANGLETDVKILKLIIKSLGKCSTPKYDSIADFYNLQLEYFDKTIGNLEDKVNYLNEVSISIKKAID